MNHNNSFSHEEIARLIYPGSRVLDLGCGNGELLEHLIREKKVLGRGVDKSEEMIIACISKGLSVVQGNLEEGLKEFPDKSYDYVILNQTLQMIYDPVFLLKEMKRVGKKVIVNYPNFGFIVNRLQLNFLGRMPVNKNIPFQWYNTPNIHFCTRKDFMFLVEELGFALVGEIALHKDKKKRFAKNLFASQICVLLEEK